ncbi:Cysteine synthase (Partial), partial [Seminavis robusta]|eukprot:Sro3181_g344820.1 Cysteine synthase (335) ;mRNA; r:145-1418
MANPVLKIIIVLFCLFCPNNSMTITKAAAGGLTSRLATYSASRGFSLHESIVDTIGKTPIIKLQRLSPKPDVNVYVKLESENPGGSIKDRLAYGIIEWAEKHGHLQPGQTVIEASSGNTGIGLAVVCASKGYPLVVVMSESFSVERRKLMRFFGAKVVLTNPAHKASGMIIKTKELADKHGYFWPDQFSHEANQWIHQQTTGPEIVAAFAEKKLDHFVCAYGTGGTVVGTSRYLKEHMPATKIHVCEPSNAPMLYSGIKSTYDGDSRIPEKAHPVWRPHLFQGWATDFVPRLMTDLLTEFPDMDIMPTSGFDAIDCSREMAKKEGIFSGTSGGGV